MKPDHRPTWYADGPWVAPVIPIAHYRRTWHAATAACSACAHEWRAVLHCGGDSRAGLECPACGQLAGQAEIVHLEPMTVPAAMTSFIPARILLDTRATLTG